MLLFPRVDSSSLLCILRSFIVQLIPRTIQPRKVLVHLFRHPRNDGLVDMLSVVNLLELLCVVPVGLPHHT